MHVQLGAEEVVKFEGNKFHADFFRLILKDGASLSVGRSYGFAQIAADAQIGTPGGKTYDVSFIGTDNGKVTKAVNAESPESVEKVSSVVIEDVQVFPPNVPVRNPKVVRDFSVFLEGRLIAVSDSEVEALGLRRRSSDGIISCSECVALQDSYCARNKENQKRRGVRAPKWSDESCFYESVATGVHPACLRASQFLEAGFGKLCSQRGR